MSIKKIKTQAVRDFFIYIFTGFFIIFALSLLFPQDICGSEEVRSSPRIFFAFGSALLIIFYFINRAIKNTWLFLLVVAVFSIIFEYLFIARLIGLVDLMDWESYIGMAIYWIAWFGLTRVVYKKICF